MLILIFFEGGQFGNAFHWFFRGYMYLVILHWYFLKRGECGNTSIIFLGWFGSSHRLLWGGGVHCFLWRDFIYNPFSGRGVHSVMVAYWVNTPIIIIFFCWGEGWMLFLGFSFASILTSMRQFWCYFWGSLLRQF